MIETKPEHRPSISDILGNAYFGHVEFSNDIFDTCD